MQMMSSMLTPQQRQMVSQLQGQPQEAQAQRIADIANERGLTKQDLQRIIDFMKNAK